MDLQEWKINCKKRNDISSYLIHFTKTIDTEIGIINSTYILSEILSERLLKGSTTESGFIHGNKPAVCLHDIPIQCVANTMYENSITIDKDKDINTNFTGIGLCFSKRFIYKNGGRPVIYDNPHKAKQYLDKDEWWRIVNLNLSNDKNIIDWTHEREWRVPNNLAFNLSDVTIIVPNNDILNDLEYLCKENKLDILNSVHSIVNINLLRR